MAERTGIAPTTLSQLENDKQNVTPRFLEQLAEFYGCIPHDLMPGAREVAQPENVSPEIGSLCAAVAARDVDRVVAVLRSLGIQVTARASSDEVTFVESQRRDLALDQILNATRTLQSVLRGLDWAEQALTNGQQPASARRLLTLEVHPTAGDVLREVAGWAAESREAAAVTDGERAQFRALERAARDLLDGTWSGRVFRREPASLEED